MKLSPVLKITTAAMLMCLAIIFTQLIVLDIPPFIRIGIGALPVIFASVILGPIYGGVVGALADVLGFFLFDRSGYPYTPFVTISGIILGVLPYFVFLVTKKLRYQKKPWPLSYLLMISIWTFLLVYVLTAGQVTLRLDANTMVTYVFDIYWKVLTPIVTAVVFGLFTLFIHFSNRYFQKRILDLANCPSPHEVAFLVLLLEILVNIIWGSVWKSVFFHADFMVILFLQGLILVLAFPVKTFILNYLFMIYYRYVDKARSNKVD